MREDALANMQPLRREDLPDLEDVWDLYDRSMGFVPRSLFTMARRPEILRAFSDLITAIWRTGTLPVSLKPLVAIVSSTAAGCRYCQAHETVDARLRGVAEDKIADIWDFERSPRYSDGERAALRFARDASVLPNEVTPAHFEQLRRSWDEGQIVEILAVVGLFGFLNRWNDTMSTELEPEPFAFAARTIGARGWKPGKHGPSGTAGSTRAPSH